MKNSINQNSLITRRQSLIASALSYGSISMRSLITGLPIAFLAGKPEHTWAAENEHKFLIFSHQQAADPINTNCPGTYGDPNNEGDVLHLIDHPTVAELGTKAEGFENPATFNLGSQTVRAAKCWSELPQDLLDRSAFWHHGTFTNAHPDFKVVMGLNGALKGPDLTGTDHMGSFIAYENAEALGTLSKELIRIGGSATNSNGLAAPELRPADIKTIFGAKVSNFDNMVAMRDQFVDQVFEEVKTSGTIAQRKFLSDYVTSRSEAQALGDSLADLIVDINGNDTANQAKMAAALIQLKVAPVVTMGFRFGGDNHGDANLTNEVDQTLETMSAIQTLWEKLKFASVEDRVVYASLHPFGRTLKRSATGGRDHNGRHHVMHVFGHTIKAGVIGGMEPYDRRRDQIDFSAKHINSQDGSTGSNADIPYDETLSAVGKTLAVAVGISETRINERINGGKIITAALNT